MFFRGGLDSLSDCVPLLRQSKHRGPSLFFLFYSFLLLWKYFHSAVIASICSGARGNAGRVAAAERVERVVVVGFLDVAAPRESTLANVFVVVCRRGKSVVINWEESEFWNQR